MDNTILLTCMFISFESTKARVDQPKTTHKK